MRFLLVVLSLSLVFSAAPNLRLPTPDNLKDFLIGNLVSLQVVQSIPDGFACAINLSNLKNNTKNALSLFLKGHFVDALHLIEQTINQTLTSCEAANKEGLATFENFLRIIRDPEFLATAIGRIRDNQLTLLEDLAQGFEDLNNASYFNAGVAFGKIPHLVLSGPDSSRMLNFMAVPNNISTPLMDFLRGFLEAVKVWADVPDGLACLDDIAGLKTALAQVLALVKQFKIIEAIELMNKIIGNDLTTCHNTVQESVKVFQALLTNVGQAGFFDLAKGRIMDNLLTLLGDFENGVKSVGAQDYYGAGRALGDIPHIILSGPDPQ